MKGFVKWLLLSVLVIILSAAALIFTSLPGSSAGVATEQASAPDPGRPPLSLFISRPVSLKRGGKYPLVVISHGTGGSQHNHIDTAAALVRAGHIVVALDHTGDNYRDLSSVGKGSHLANRPRHISRTIDFMLQRWPQRDFIDADRIGMFGFSAGGFTALVLAGAQPDLSRTADHCRRNPEAWTCRYVRKQGLPQAKIGAQKNIVWQSDPRIKAIAVAAPAVGYSFDHERLAKVQIPVQLWGAEKDAAVDDSAELVRAAMNVAPEYHVIANASHFAFLIPCKAQMRIMMAVMHWFGTEPVCDDPAGFDREAFHRTLNAEIVRFFRLAMPGTVGKG